MGLLNSALNIGRSALLSYEGALQIVGTNISSAGSPDFTRLSPQLDPLQGTPITGDLQPGAGVALSAIQRHINEALEGRLRLAIGAESSASTQFSALAQLEPMFDELNATGIGSRLTRFFNAFGELQNTPEDAAIRDLVVSDAATLAQSLRETRAQLTAIGADLDAQIGATVEAADGIAHEIGRLNEEISMAEASARVPASGLRDQRDARLRQLAELLDVTVREQANGTVNVYVGSEVLVQGNSVRSLVAVAEVEGGSMRTTVRFAGTNQQVNVGGGRLAGLLRSRDQNAPIEALDQLAAALIADANRIHADGQGMIGFESVTTSGNVPAADVPLDAEAAGLVPPPQSGSFFITVIDGGTGTPVASRIDVNLDGTGGGTTLETLAADINDNVDGVTATITGDNRMTLTAEEGSTFTFGFDGQDARADTSGVLAALGINTLFTGSNAQDIAINESVAEQPLRLAAAQVFLPGDGTNAGRISALGTAVSRTLGDASLSGFFRSIANAVALKVAAVRDEQEATSSIATSLRTQRESISGVNLDEEAISLLKFQRAFQSTSRFIRVVDDLIAELISLVR